MLAGITMSIHSAVPILIAEKNLERAKQGQLPLRQSEIAKESGVSQSVISTLASGKSRRIDFDTIDKLCAYFHCEPGDLFIREASTDALA